MNCLVFVCVLLSLASEQQPNSGTAEQVKQESKQSPAPVPVPHGDGAVNGASAGTGAQGESAPIHASDLEPTFRWKNEITPGDVLVAVTNLIYLLLLLFTWLTWREMVRNNKQTAEAQKRQNEDTEASLAIAGKAADAATKAAGVAERSLRETQRAFLGAVGFGISGFEIGKVPACTVFIRNSGRTPARVIYQTTKVVISPDYPDIPSHSPAVFYAVPPDILPDQTTDIKAARASALTDREMTKLTDKTSILHVVGKVTYQDVFGTTHDLPYAVIYSVEEGRFVSTLFGLKDAAT